MQDSGWHAQDVGGRVPGAVIPTACGQLTTGHRVLLEMPRLGCLLQAQGPAAWEAGCRSTGLPGLWAPPTHTNPTYTLQLHTVLYVTADSHGHRGNVE